MSKHIPGPWYQDGDLINFGYTDHDGNRRHGTICEVALRGDTKRANARLISKAPELLEHLRWIRDCARDVQEAKGRAIIALREIERESNV